MEKMKEQLVGADITVMCDEVFINNPKIVHVLIGAVGEKLSLVSSTSVEQCNSLTNCQAVEDAIKNYTLVERTCRTSDATHYMVKAGYTLKNLFYRIISRIGSFERNSM